VVEKAGKEESATQQKRIRGDTFKARGQWFGSSQQRGGVAGRMSQGKIGEEEKRREERCQWFLFSGQRMN